MNAIKTQQVENPSQGPRSTTRPDTPANETLGIQQRVYRMQQTVNRQQGMTSQAAANLCTELRTLGQQVNHRFRQVQNNSEHLRTDRDNLKAAIAEKQRLITNALAERDRACTERDNAIEEIAKMKVKYRSFDEQLASIEQRWLNEVEHMKLHIQFLEDQRDGKRALWMEYNPKSGRKTASIRETPKDPYSTPPDTTTLGGRSFPLVSARAPPPSFNLNSESSWTSSPKAALSTSFSLMPTGPAHASRDVWSSHPTTKLSAAGSRANYGSDDHNIPSSTSLVPFQSQEELQADFVKGFGAVYAMLFGWTNKYANKVGSVEADQAIQENAFLWEFIMSCVSPYSGKMASAHVMSLLRDASSRAWFVMRMAVEYVCNRIWHDSAWLGFSDEFDTRMKHITSRLATKGLDGEERVELIDERTQIIQSLIDSDKYSPYRSLRLSQHAKKLRDALGPVLNMDAKRADAGKDLSAIAARAFDLSAKMYTSGWTFLVVMPETGCRFLHPTMVQRNSKESPLNLHIQQVRVKLVVTPSITMRDDHMMTIRTKTIESSNVLVA